MKTLIVCVSTSNGNTRKVADRLAAVLHADVVEPEDVVIEDLPSYDLVGFGSGIYLMSVHPRLLALIGKLPVGEGRPVFTFSTSGSAPLPLLGTGPVRRWLGFKGYRPLGDFNCRGLDTVGLLGLIGGINKGRPDEHDLGKAEQFARTMLSATERALAVNLPG
jgi:flavodoxin